MVSAADKIHLPAASAASPLWQHCIQEDLAIVNLIDLPVMGDVIDLVGRSAMDIAMNLVSQSVVYLTSVDLSDLSLPTVCLNAVGVHTVSVFTLDLVVINLFVMNLSAIDVVIIQDRYRKMKKKICSH